MLSIGDRAFCGLGNQQRMVTSNFILKRSDLVLTCDLMIAKVVKLPVIMQ